MFIISPILADNLILLDKIETVIYGPEETSIITRSDLERKALDGSERTSEKLVFEHLVFQDAKKYNVMDEKLVDRYIEAIQSQHNLSLEDLKKMFYDSGYTYEEGREQLAMFNTINQLLDFKVRSKVIIPEADARAYYDANPIYEPKAYFLNRIFVPQRVDMSMEEHKKKIERYVSLGQDIPGADRVEFWLNDEDMAQDKAFIKDMKVDEISAPQYLDGGFEMFKMIKRRERQAVPFEQRYREISTALSKPLYEKLFDDYKSSLFQDSMIVNMP